MRPSTRLERAIADREPMLLYGDYDVDGTTAVVLLKTAIEMLGGAVRFHVPHRLLEGYGLQSSVLEAAYADGVRLVITVDTGMRAFAEAETARRLGLDLIITDHHLPKADDAVPAALAILNPNQPGCGYPEKSLCGAAIALKLAQALLERRDPMRTREKILPSFLKMAAIATIADAVPLRGENRVIAALGLRELRRPVGAGLRALVRSRGARSRIEGAYRLRRGLSPCAAHQRRRTHGRGLRGDRAVLHARSGAARTNWPTKLERLNRERRDTEATALAAIEARLADDADLAAGRLLVVDGDGWHRGVIGILASRVVERTAKPAIVVSVEDGIAMVRADRSMAFRCSRRSRPAPICSRVLADMRLRSDSPCPPMAFPNSSGGSAFTPKHVWPRANRNNCCVSTPSCRSTALRRCWPAGCASWSRWATAIPSPFSWPAGRRIASPPRVMKDRHIRLELTQESNAPVRPRPVRPSGLTRALGWDWAGRCMDLQLCQGSMIDLAYRIRENDHPDFGGIEVEICGIRPAEA